MRDKSNVQNLGSNQHRLAEFQTRSVIDVQVGKKVVYKYAMTPQAQSFIESIVEREKKSRNYLKGHFDVLCGDLEDGRIRYDYLPYPCLLDKVRLCMQSGNFHEGQNLLEKYIHKIEALGKTETVPIDFLRFVADDGNCQSKVSCLRLGLLDLTPKNILIDGDRWIVIDSEWAFDFPIPVVFLLFRSIMELSILLQRPIRKCTSRSNPAAAFFGTAIQTYYIPQIWMRYMSHPHIDLDQMARWELGFQRYVAGPRINTVGRIKRCGQTRHSFSKVATINYMGIIRRIQRFAGCH